MPSSAGENCFCPGSQYACVYVRMCPPPQAIKNRLCEMKPE